MNDVHMDDREPEILQAYVGLGTPTSPPEDLLVRVERGIRRRRNVRRGMAGAAVLAVVGGVGVGVLGGDDGSVQVAEDTGDTSTLTYTETDGATFTFEAEDIDVACSTDGKRLYLARNQSADAVRAGRMPGDFPESQLVLPVLYVELIVGKIDPGETFELPFDARSGDSDERAMTFFFTAGDEVDDSNELSSSESGSSGTVTIHEASCGPTPSLWIEIDAVLGSEEQLAPLAMKGEYRS